MLSLEPVAQKRAKWNGVDVGLTAREFDIVLLLNTPAGEWKTYQQIWNVMYYEGFVNEGFRTNVRSMVKRIRVKFRSIDQTFDAISTYSRIGYNWKEGSRDVEELILTDSDRCTRGLCCSRCGFPVPDTERVPQQVLHADAGQRVVRQG